MKWHSNDPFDLPITTAPTLPTNAYRCSLCGQHTHVSAYHPDRTPVQEMPCRVGRCAEQGGIRRIVETRP